MEEEPKPYAILGLHGEDVKSVLDNVARIRMFVGDQMIDEDFILPRLITIEEQIHDAVIARIAEINAKGTDPKLSEVVPEQTEQIVAEVPSV